MIAQEDSSDWLTREHAGLIAQVEVVESEARQRGIRLPPITPAKSHDSRDTQMLVAGTIGPVSAVSLLDAYEDRFNSGSMPQLIRQKAALDGIEVGAGLITVIGAPPGAGKTALASQVAFDACELDPNQIVYNLNAEMSFDALLRRQITKATRIASDKVRFGHLSDAELSHVKQACELLRSKLDRFSIYENPGMGSLLDLLGQPPGLIVVDYLQKFAPADQDVRHGVNAVMTMLRRLANAGHAVLALSATKRSVKGTHDSKELSLSSFKESGEVEFNADSAYVLRDDGPIDSGCQYIRRMTLGHVKNRHGAKVDRALEFHMPRMEFTAPAPTVHEEFAQYADDGDPSNPFGGSV
ncbi:MAG: DnaB-like helicase C-terminal domain-containing protein [Planctomycetota bacterium]